MKRILKVILIVVALFSITSCKRCKSDITYNCQYVGVYLQITSNIKERNLDDQNIKLYMNVENNNFVTNVNHMIEYRVNNGSILLLEESRRDDSIVYSFGSNYTILLNSDILNKVDIYPIIYTKNKEFVVLDEKFGTIELEDQHVKGLTYKKEYKYNGQNYVLEVLIRITKKIIG